MIQHPSASHWRCDRAHYINDRYGLGTCYLRTSKIRLAEYHYRKALEIHPQNAVLLGCVGMVSQFRPRLLIRELLTRLSQTVERRGDKNVAYSLFDQAVRLAPDNALVRYRRAKMLISMKRYKVGSRRRNVYYMTRVLSMMYRRRLKICKSFAIARPRNRMWYSSSPRSIDLSEMRRNPRSGSRLRVTYRRKVSTS